MVDKNNQPWEKAFTDSDGFPSPRQSDLMMLKLIFICINEKGLSVSQLPTFWA